MPAGPNAGVLQQTVAFHRDPLGFLRREQDRYGDVFSIRLLTARPLVVSADPEAVEALMGSDPISAHAGEARRRILPFASPRSVFGGDERAHAAARGRIESAFAPELMEERRTEIARIAERHLERWPRGRPFRLLPRIRTLLDEVFVRLLLGVREEETALGLVLAMRRMLWTPGNPPVSLPGRGNGLMGDVGEILFERRQAPVARLLARAVEERRFDREGMDVLGRMVRAEPPLDTPEIVDELMSTLMAAQEPPSIALSWIVDRLSRHPGAAEQFLTSPESAAGDATVKETLRLHPPAAGVLRRLTLPMPLGEWVVPAGATVIMPIAMVQRDPRIWSNADAFRPERWLSETPPAFHFPFGGGARRCIGEPLALAEIRTVIPAILGRLSLRPIRPEPERMVVRGTVLVPQRSLLVTATDSP
ncbi:MAG: cytochrome P450 [Solirubrobacterales bacterium]